MYTNLLICISFYGDYNCLKERVNLYTCHIFTIQTPYIYCKEALFVWMYHGWRTSKYTRLSLKQMYYLSSIANNYINSLVYKQATMDKLCIEVIR